MSGVDVEEMMAYNEEDDDDLPEGEHGDGEGPNELADVEETYEADMNEMIEIDEVMLVQELRRAKHMMNERKRRSLNESKRRNMFETQLKQVIDEEVQNVLADLNLSSQWVYGNKQPRRSKGGYVTQGTMLQGLGFSNSGRR